MGVVKILRSDMKLEIADNFKFGANISERNMDVVFVIWKLKSYDVLDIGTNRNI